MPALLAALAATADPDVAFAQFDRFLSNLPSGVQIFSLLLAQSELLRLIAAIMGSAPRLAAASRAFARRRSMRCSIAISRCVAHPRRARHALAKICSAFRRLQTGARCGAPLRQGKNSASASR